MQNAAPSSQKQAASRKQHDISGKKKAAGGKRQAASSSQQLAAQHAPDLVQRHTTAVQAIKLDLERPSPNDVMKLMGLGVKYAP